MLKIVNICLYVSDVERSTTFYSRLFDTEPEATFPGFAMFRTVSGHEFDLWQLANVAPSASMTGGGGEYSFDVASDEELDKTHAAWTAKGVEIILSPTDVDFGRTFVGRDPDGHRLRVVSLKEPQ